MKLSHVIEELIEEKGLDRQTLDTVVTEGMLSAYRKKYPNATLDVHYDKKTDEIVVKVQKTVVSSVRDEDTEISLRKARNIQEDVVLGDTLWLSFEKPIGRIEILKARQIIAQKIRSIEASQVYNEFKPKEGTIVNGNIHKSERNGVTVKIQDAFGFLPKSLMIPEEKCVPGYTVRALLKEVYPEPRNENQLILDRVSPLFLRNLFELEIPEVFERLIEIKSIVRAPGYKAKVLVSSNDENIDPVGTCVGPNGARIKPILRELGSEKIDIIRDTESREELVRSALKPAEVQRVELHNGSATVWVDDEQRSQAIGKYGQNIDLASRLTGIEIHINRPEGDEQETETAETQDTPIASEEESAQ